MLLLRALALVRSGAGHVFLRDVVAHLSGIPFDVGPHLHLAFSEGGRVAIHLVVEGIEADFAGVIDRPQRWVVAILLLTLTEAQHWVDILANRVLNVSHVKVLVLVYAVRFEAQHVGALLYACLLVISSLTTIESHLISVIEVLVAVHGEIDKGHGLVVSRVLVGHGQLGLADIAAGGRELHLVLLVGAEGCEVALGERLDIPFVGFLGLEDAHFILIFK